MALRFFIKKFPKYKYEIRKTPEIDLEKKKNIESDNLSNNADTIKVNKNKKQKKQEDMDFSDKMKKIEETLVSMETTPTVKFVKSEKGLIERTESSKIVLTEDNRQLLND